MKKSFPALTIAVLTLAAAARAGDDAGSLGDGYLEGNFGRIRHIENGATILRSGAGDAERFGDSQPTSNTPIFPGDSLRTGRDQRVEVQLASGTVVWLDRDSDLVFQALPRPGAEYQDNTVLSFAVGSARVVSGESGGEEVRLDTPSSSVYILGEADVRIDVDANGATRVFSRRGVVEVSAEEGSVLVRGGMRATVHPGSTPSEPRALNTMAVDAFDTWCDVRKLADRSQRFASDEERGAYETLPYEVRPYYGELSAHGNWVHTPTYGTVWYPTGVAVGWRPYWDGYWAYGPSGYFWIASEPWGWAPSHYGRWMWVGGYGWCWAPGSVFGGAWVSWSWGSVYVGWAPLDYWNYPCAGPAPYHGYYDPYSWTFVHYDGFAHARPYRRHAVPVDSVLAAHTGAAIVTRPPKVSPATYASSPEARRRAARQASDDREARLPATPGSFARTPDRKFVEMERRARPEAAGSPRAPAARREPAFRTAPSISPSRPGRPDARDDLRGAESRTASQQAGATPRRLLPATREEGSKRSVAPTARSDERPKGTAGPRTEGPRVGGRDATGGFLRRFERDPAASDRGDGRVGTPDRSFTREQRRDMYHRLASPRETRPRADDRGGRNDAPPSKGASPRAGTTERSDRPAAPQAKSPQDKPAPKTQHAERGRTRPQRGDDAASRGGGGKRGAGSSPAERREERPRRR